MTQRLRLPPNPSFAMCESVAAGSTSLWHIRAIPVGESPKFTGGITTSCLCGHVKAGRGWDLDVAITPFHLSRNVSSRCATLYQIECERAC